MEARLNRVKQPISRTLIHEDPVFRARSKQNLDNESLDMYNRMPTEESTNEVERDLHATRPSFDFD